MEQKFSILYLDDEEQNLVSFQALLRKEYKVFTTSDAHEATEILSRENIAVIFSDQKMPEVSGVEFFENIIHEYPTPVRILLTGHADIEAVIDAINKGQVYRYVSKPWEAGDLKICIENAIEKFSRDADLLLKKSLLLNTQSEKAIAQVFNQLYELLAMKSPVNPDTNNITSILTNIKIQQQLALLCASVTNNNWVSGEESRAMSSSKDLLSTTLNCCNRITMIEGTQFINNYIDNQSECPNSAKIASVILYAAQLASSEEQDISLQLEMNENQEKYIGKIQFTSTIDWPDHHKNAIQSISENLDTYLKKNRGGLQLELNAPTVIRITFEGQHN